VRVEVLEMTRKGKGMEKRKRTNETGRKEKIEKKKTALWHDSGVA